MNEICKWRWGSFLWLSRLALGHLLLALWLLLRQWGLLGHLFLDLLLLGSSGDAALFLLRLGDLLFLIFLLGLLVLSVFRFMGSQLLLVLFQLGRKDVIVLLLPLFAKLFPEHFDFRHSDLVVLCSLLSLEAEEPGERSLGRWVLTLCLAHIKWIAKLSHSLSTNSSNYRLNRFIHCLLISDWAVRKKLDFYFQLLFTLLKGPSYCSQGKPPSRPFNLHSEIKAKWWFLWTWFNNRSHDIWILIKEFMWESFGLLFNLLWLCRLSFGDFFFDLVFGLWDLLWWRRFFNFALGFDWFGALFFLRLRDLFLFC